MLMLYRYVVWRRSIGPGSVNGRIEGYREAGLGTADPDFWLAFFQELGGWRLRWEGPSPVQPLWPRKAPRPDHEWLLAPDGARCGQVRLFRFPADVPAPRVGARIHDTGGIFDLDVRVADVHAWRTRLLDLGWSDFGPAVDWPFGELEVREWLAQGPDGVVVAFVQRLQPPLDPPLEPPASRGGFGHAFNSSQLVRDMEAALAFYRALGFGERVRHRGPLEGRGGEVLGLAPDCAPHTPVDLAIVAPGDALEGSIELLALPETPGEDRAPACGPGRRGLNLLRLPVVHLEAFASSRHASGLAPRAMAEWDLPPLGPVRGLALESPDGAWLELVEAKPTGD